MVIFHDEKTLSLILYFPVSLRHYFPTKRFQKQPFTVVLQNTYSKISQNSQENNFAGASSELESLFVGSVHLL